MTTTTPTQETTRDASTDDRLATAPDSRAGAEDGDDPSSAAGLPLDLVFESLKNSRRRQVLEYLQQTDGPAAVGELAEHVAAIENDTTVRQLSSQQRKRVYVGLYQCHLPKLDGKDVVDYDDDRGTVELGPNAAQLARYLDVSEEPTAESDVPWHRYYLAVAGGGAVLLFLALVVGGSAVGPAGATIGFGLVSLLAGLSLVHARETRADRS